MTSAPVASGSPITAFVDALRTVLTADTTLMGLVSTVTGALPGSARVAYPYVLLGTRHRDNSSGAMQVAGGQVAVQIDVWSDAKGPATVQAVLSRIAFLLERRPLPVAGFACLDGSLTCEIEDVFDEPDEDSPERRLFHGVQRWTALVHEL